MSKQPLSGETSGMSGETAGRSGRSLAGRAHSDDISTLPLDVDLRVQDDVALSEIELYAEVLGAVASDDEQRIEELLGPG